MHNHSPLIKFFNTIGIPTFNYVDDSNVGCPYHKLFSLSFGTFLNNCLSLSFHILNKKKTSLHTLLKKAEVLGHVVDLELMRFKLTERARHSILIAINRALSNKYISLRLIAKIKGKLIAFKAAIYFVSQLTRNFNAFASQILSYYPEHTGWNKKVQLPSFVRDELMFWYENLPALSSKPIFFDDWSCDVYTDASDSHVASHCQHGWSVVPLSDTLKKESSTAREAFGILSALFARASMLKGKSVRVFSDNLGITTALCRNGSKNHTISLLIKKIVLFLFSQNISANFRWLPRDEPGLQLADGLSKVVEKDNWATSPLYISLLLSFFRLPPITLDCFASLENRVTRRYVSRLWEDSEDLVAIDFFNMNKYDWVDEFCWVNPPFSQKMINFALDCVSARNIFCFFVLPLWENCSFYRHALKKGDVFIVFPKGVPLFTPSSRFLRNGGIYKPPAWSTLVVLFLGGRKLNFGAKFFEFRPADSAFVVRSSVGRL